MKSGTGYAGRVRRMGDTMRRGTVLVTGANSGIGLATAVETARRGYRVVGTVRAPSKAKVVRGAAREAGVEVETALLDVTDAQRCEKVVGGTRPLHGLVNNAGYGGVGAVEDVSDEEARAMWETMVLAPVRLARLALPAMREAGGGRIVNVSSIYGRATTPLTGWYQGCKHALEGISDALRTEVASSGVRVILVEPGSVRTGIWEDVDSDVEKRGGSRFGDSYRRTQTLTRLSEPLMARPERVARTIADALDSSHPRARYVVGADARAMSLADRATVTVVKDRVKRLVFGL